jgi:hypothetical protein
MKAYKFTDNQQEILDHLLVELGAEKDKRLHVLYVSYNVVGGWVVYLTGANKDLIERKTALLKDMIRKDADEFGKCRICIAPVKGADWDGIVIRFDRGLRLVHE